MYVFGHANVWHWLLNSWCMVVLHNLFGWKNTVTAYVLAVVVSYVPNYSLVTDAEVPVVGFSTILMYMYGLATEYFWRREKWIVISLLSFLGVGYLIPNCAAMWHALMWIAGVTVCGMQKMLRWLSDEVEQ